MLNFVEVQFFGRRTHSKFFFLFLKCNTKVFETIRGTSKRLQYSSNWNKLTAKFLCYSFHFGVAKSQKAVPTHYLLMEYQEKKGSSVWDEIN